VTVVQLTNPTLLQIPLLLRIDGRVETFSNFLLEVKASFLDPTNSNFKVCLLSFLNLQICGDFWAPYFVASLCHQGLFAEKFYYSANEVDMA